MQDKIIIHGAREHNLKNINLEIPRNKMTVFTGLSGSGKSSLAFDTIFAEGQRRYVESLSAYARQFLGQMNKPDVDEIEGLSPAISIDQKAHSANPRSTVATITEIYDYLRVLFARIGKPHCPVCGKEIRKMTVEEMVDRVLKKVAENHQAKNNKLKPAFAGDSSLAQNDIVLVMAPVVKGRKGEYYQLLYDLYNDGFAEVRVNGKFKELRNKIILPRYKQHNIDLVVDKVTLGWPIENNKGLRARLAEAIETALKYGGDIVSMILDNGEEIVMSSKFSCPEDNFSFPEIEPRLFSFNSPYGACEACHGLGTKFLFSEEVCPDCEGNRLRKESLHVLVAGKNIVEVTGMSIENAHNFFSELMGKDLKTSAPIKVSADKEKLKPRIILSENDLEIGKAIFAEILNRLGFMLDVGLGYLTLNRTAGTLSGGEAQRIRLASQVGSKLVGALYILDEPTIGLHPKDNEKLLATLRNIRDIGNTVIVVEHDPETIWTSDYLVDIGPGAGKHGGEIVAAGPMPDVLEDKKSLTAAYLRGDKFIKIPEKRRKVDGESKYFSSGQLKIVGANENNLKNIDVRIPLKRFVCVTGVSGSGKSTLVNDILLKGLSNKLNHTSYQVGKHSRIEGMEYLDKIIEIDQSPIGRTPRSNPATYTGSWTMIRELFASTPEARTRGYKVGRFSFNVPGGRCENCEGAGLIKVEMHFLPAVYVPCDVCKGTRFDRETLAITYKEKNIHDILKMTIEDAEEFFKNIPLIKDRMKILREVGLQYLTLGQAATTLSGGEAQRIKLGAELAKRSTGRTIYILDEPTVGLHYADVEKLLEVLHRLVNLGNTVIVIEHNLDFIKTADWIIDLGPDGGNAGGELITAGTPEEVARIGKSYTGQYLKKTLNSKS
ncbi:ABC-ATPase UvrA [Candidatus Falkowbacteria bacterium RIFOXYB2_FULL_38_15]|uniref:UvrABC system protein A n=1 Tax=Candidatus Falkowbacteria bacterium RIFOXYA2_FULL_38_12 TaxID=1797993 RepID=A0A1F5S567_9BACT|nr:MAG: ABC-ATPase UvrA [Candidatus Falkowbacteria bacterium RIFOXYA2_FULL_38_12]OGF32620.1 MAG: ABC-ATPase UvrA [Candidatus Falkowbacteria bacterium RIFOXYB2_FULL_38_15]OGF44572.1 MAG: ABC-ATPase UvrA [Candidatus Falkowbacteria bacterium RIFOXYD2_FULL_39_16]